MSCTVLYGGREGGREAWAKALTHAFDESALDAELLMHADQADWGEVDYLLCQSHGTVEDYSGFPRLKGLLSLWAGVEWLKDDPTLPAGVPVVRMVEDGMTQGMTDYIAGHALRFLLEADREDPRPDAERWGMPSRPLASQLCVGVMGMGELGRAAARVLRAIGFQVAGWSRTGRQVDGVRCFAGPGELDSFLGQSNLLVILLPLTADTRDLVDADALAALPRGAALINAARGAIIDDDALVSALDSGHLHHATLDVFRVEPLPEDHRLRNHPRITVTPHIASATRPETAARSIARQVARREAGLEFEHVLKPDLGY